MSNRDTTLTIRLSRQEKETIKDRAAANGLDVSEHVRRAAMSHGVTTPVVPVVEAELVGVDELRFGRIRRIFQGLRTRRAA